MLGAEEGKHTPRRPPPIWNLVGGIPRDFIQKHYMWYVRTFVQLPLAHPISPLVLCSSRSPILRPPTDWLWMLSPNESLSLPLPLALYLPHEKYG